VRIYLESYGCAQNQGEGAAIARDLSSRGHGMVRSPEGADAAVLVTCGVIGATEARMVRRWRVLSQLAPRVVVTGCLVPLRTELFSGPGRAWTEFVPIREQARLSLILGGRAEDPTPRSAIGPESIPPPVVEEIVIAQGCTSGCTYCFSRLARGRLTSVSPWVIVARIEEALRRGARELRFTSLDTAAWGADLAGHPGLPELLREASEVDADFRLRVGMMSPQSLEPILEPYLDALADPRIFRFLHLPVQSGSDAILDAMHRGYRVAEFRRQVAAARQRFPGLHLATDFIVGFPGETEDDHRASEELLEEMGPETVNVTRFSARPGTPAARLPPVSSAVVKRRSRSLTAVRQRVARERMERWIGERARA
jgi:threonylcarbamoyladenosine tRNA methylthiotransferase CDKAL1